MANEIILANGKRIATQEITETNGTTNVIKHHQRVIVEQSGTVATPLLKFFRDSVNNEQFAQDGSVTQIEMKVQPAASAIYRITGIKLVMSLVLAPTDPDQLGDQGSLASGLTLKHLDDNGDILDVLDGETITSNTDLSRYADIQEAISLAGLFVARFKFAGPIRVEGTDDNERLSFFIDDNLTGFSNVTALAEGFIETTRT